MAKKIFLLVSTVSLSLQFLQFHSGTKNGILRSSVIEYRYWQAGQVRDLISLLNVIISIKPGAKAASLLRFKIFA